MVGWHHHLIEHELEQALGDSEGQGSLAYCRSWRCKVRHDLVTEKQQYVEKLKRKPKDSSSLK